MALLFQTKCSYLLKYYNSKHYDKPTEQVLVNIDDKKN